MAPFFALKYAPPAMAKTTPKQAYPNAAPKDQRYGSIIVVSSVASTYGGRFGVNGDDIVRLIVSRVLGTLLYYEFSCCTWCCESWSCCAERLDWGTSRFERSTTY
jgi:NAD(P)-dependent dehydrogenase (short-subunit alcohol dehydrogenase family)